MLLPPLWMQHQVKKEIPTRDILRTRYLMKYLWKTYQQMKQEDLLILQMKMTGEHMKMMTRERD